jgi:transcriptional regulator with XRE-family HTH domain
MKKQTSLLRKAHFLGAKIKNLRKRNNLTLEDLSVRCIHINADAAPSISYLSMIENGNRVPSEEMLQVIATVFQKSIDWFFDESSKEDAISPVKKSSGGISGIQLEPGFLFSKDHLQIAIPELLSQTGTNGRQFAHLLIRAHQEHHQNRFPDIERAADEVGQKQMPISIDELLKICKRLGLEIKWFDRSPDIIKDDVTKGFKTLIRAFFDPPSTIYLNERLKDQPARLKYDLATNIGHCILHDKDGLRGISAAGGSMLESNLRGNETQTINSKDILHAWRDFECSFFAGALLCPKVPFRQHLSRYAYAIDTAEMLEVSFSVMMRRMTAVSPYPHWHYFDAYPPGNLRAVYRGNGIPLPWGNMRMVLDPCQHWAVFRMLHTESTKPSSQISILRNDDDARLYCCESIRTKDAAGNYHVICAGIDLAPALEAQGKDTQKIIETMLDTCIKSGGSAEIPNDVKQDIKSVAKILNISWIEKGLEKEMSIICPRSSACPRQPVCVNKPADKVRPVTEEIRDEIIRNSQ